MKKNNILCLSIAVLALLVSQAEAAPARTAKRPAPVKVVDYDEGSDEGDVYSSVPSKENNWYLFGGLDLGFSQYGAYTPATEGSRSGFDGGVRVLLARYWKKWVLDGGIGYRYISNSGTNFDTTTTKVTTRAGFLDLSPRYRAGKNWQIGPELQYWLTGDNGLNPDPNSSASNNSAWIGLQAMYEWMGDDNKFRLGARWQTAMNVEKRSVNIFQAFFQIGFSMFDSKSDEDYQPRRRNEQISDRDLEKAADYTTPSDPLPIATPFPTPEATPWPTPEMAVVKPQLGYHQSRGVVGQDVTIRPAIFKDNGVPVTSCTASPPLPAWATLDTTNCVVTGTPTEIMAPATYIITATNEQGQSSEAKLILSVGPGAKPKAQERLVLTLDVNDLPFAFDSARLPKYNADRVREVGRFLGEHKGTWKQLVVEGHTDERGSNEYNDKLSTARAQTVKQLLAEGGAPSGRIKAVGYGERKPKVRGHTEKAWAQNRRVELVFKGVKDVVIMRDALKRGN